MSTETINEKVSPQTGDPRDKGPKPEFNENNQEGSVGSSAQMNVQPDYGEKSYKGTGKLVGKKALITGGDSGIGRAVALAFAREGADVAISYLNEEEDAQETVRLISSAGRKALSLPGTIEDVSHCEELIQRTVSDLGAIDILVNNAAFQMSHRVH